MIMAPGGYGPGGPLAIPFSMSGGGKQSRSNRFQLLHCGKIKHTSKQTSAKISMLYIIQ